MKFSCAKTELSEAIAVCSHAASSKSTDPILEGLLFNVDERVRITGYNLKLGISKTIDASVYKTGAFVLNARVLGDIVRKMAGDTITFTINEMPNAEISCGAAKFTIMAQPADEYPVIPEVEKDCGISLKNPLLKQMIDQTVFAVSTNENKPTHTGVLFEVENGELTMCAVDGYRLAVRSEKVATLNAEEFRFIVPGESLREISRILPDDENDCVIYTTRKFALYEFSDVTVITRLLEGEFINYKAAIPKDQPISLRMDRQELISAIERVSIIITERLKTPVRCKFEDTSLTLNCVTPMGTSLDEIVIPKCAIPVEIGFNNSYILDALKAATGEFILFEMRSALSPCTIRPVEGDAYVYLVLPVRLRAGD